MDWRPEHEGEWQSRWPRLAKAVEYLVLTVLVLAVVTAVVLTVSVVLLFPFGVVR